MHRIQLTHQPSRAIHLQKPVRHQLIHRVLRPTRPAEQRPDRAGVLLLRRMARAADAAHGVVRGPRADGHAIRARGDVGERAGVREVGGDERAERAQPAAGERGGDGGVEARGGGGVQRGVAPQRGVEGGVWGPLVRDEEAAGAQEARDFVRELAVVNYLWAH
jgi:hypothetical protein